MGERESLVARLRARAAALKPKPYWATHDDGALFEEAATALESAAVEVRALVRRQVDYYAEQRRLAKDVDLYERAERFHNYGEAARHILDGIERLSLPPAPGGE